MDASKSSLLSDVHSSSGGVDLPDGVKAFVRRLHEPYERHRAHDLRAECYRRGIRPIKKGPNANDNKGGYIILLRKYDGTLASSVQGSSLGNSGHQLPKRGEQEIGNESVGDTSEMQIISNMTNKRNLPMTMSTQPETATSTVELQGFYDGSQGNLLAMQYPVPNLSKSATSTAENPTTDLEILSGIANSYTQNVVADGQLCGNCRTVVTDQLMESIRLGKMKMSLHEWQKVAEQRDRDTRHLKEVLDILHDLRRSYREAQVHGMSHDILVELQDDIAFFRNLKERTKERMRQTLQDARERLNKSNTTA
ncbi:hypothetical protein Plhal304r1_c003g0011521 [Plasmopara halstedii]